MNFNKNFSRTILAVMLCASSTAFGQTDLREEASFGLKAGFNLSNVWDEQDEEFEADNKVGFAAGMFLHLPLNKVIGIQPELMFSQKGFEGYGSFLGQDYSYKLTTNYLDIPILVVVKPLPQLSIVAGPTYSFLLSERRNFNSTFYTEESFEQYENDDIRKNRLGVSVGVDINLDQFVISPRAAWDLQENHSDGSSATPRYKNQFYQITFGYRF